MFSFFKKIRFYGIFTGNLDAETFKNKVIFKKSRNNLRDILSLAISLIQIPAIGLSIILAVHYFILNSKLELTTHALTSGITFALTALFSSLTGLGILGLLSSIWGLWVLGLFELIYCNIYFKKEFTIMQYCNGIVKETLDLKKIFFVIKDSNFFFNLWIFFFINLSLINLVWKYQDCKTFLQKFNLYIKWLRNIILFDFFTWFPLRIINLLNSIEDYSFEKIEDLDKIDFNISFFFSQIVTHWIIIFSFVTITFWLMQKHFTLSRTTH